MQFKST